MGRMKKSWTTKPLPLANLHLDAKNPRLGREHTAKAPSEIIKHLFDHDKAMEIAESIATRGYFPNEPLLAIKEEGRVVVVEGNRRLAALKALREPSLLDGTFGKKVERLAGRMDRNSIAKIPVTLAPSRRDTDRQVAGRHIGTPVLAWRAENQASFILDKLAEGYDNDSLREELGFSSSDIQQARLTRAVVDMARSLDLPDDVKAKLDGPSAKVFTTLERVFDSTVGRKYMFVELDPDYGLKGTTTKGEFLRGFSKLVTDVAQGKASSRTLNSSDDIKNYFEGWGSAERPKKKKGSFVPADVIKNSTESAKAPTKEPAVKKSKPDSKTVLPKDFAVRHGNERLKDLRRELVRLKREDFPNAGAVLLRVFFELAALHYLERTSELAKIVERLEKKNGGKIPHGVPTMKQLVPELIRIAKAHLKSGDATIVEKAITYNPSAPFTISDLHAFVHSKDLPGPRDIHQFWVRTEPLFRLMLEQETPGAIQ